MTNAGFFMVKYRRDGERMHDFAKVVWKYVELTSNKTVIIYSFVAVFPYYLISINLSIIKMISLVETDTLTTFYGVIFNVGYSNSDGAWFQEDT